MSENGFRTMSNASDGKNLFWTTDVNVELPIVLGNAGPAALPPRTVPKMLQ